MKVILIIVAYTAIILLLYICLYIRDIKAFKKFYPKGGDFKDWYNNTPREYQGGIGFNTLASAFWVVTIPIFVFDSIFSFILKTIRKYHNVN